MEEEKTYRPANIEFDVESGSMPQNLGFEFPEMKDAVQFIASHLISLNIKARVPRYMDNFEKNEIRKEYQELLELKIPLLERELMKAKSVYDEAKRVLSEANEFVSATTNEAKALAVEVKRGIIEMELDDLYTWSVPVGDKYFIYTFIDNQIKLCKVLDIPSFEKTELFNAMNRNLEFFEAFYPNGLVNQNKFDSLHNIEEEKPDKLTNKKRNPPRKKK